MRIVYNGPQPGLEAQGLRMLVLRGVPVEVQDVPAVHKLLLRSDFSVVEDAPVEPEPAMEEPSLVDEDDGEEDQDEDD